MTTTPAECLLKIGELAKRLGLNVRTLRYYEARGILAPSGRSEGGYRLYSAADEQVLRFVLQAKRIGFTLDEIREMVSRSRRGSPCSFVRQTLHQHRAALDARIAELQAMRTELRAAEVAWQQPGGVLSGTVCGLIETWPAGIIKSEKADMGAKRQVEVFTAGCPLCDDTVKLVQSLACSNCEVTVHNTAEAAGAARAKAAGVHRVPTVLVDGTPAECCQSGPVTEAGLRAAGVGVA